MTRAPTSVEEAVEEFLARRRAGESVAAAEFAARHAHLGSELADALETLDALGTATEGDVGFGLATPARVGAFRVVREIGRGGMGVVLEAVEEPLGRRVALKVLPPELLSSPAARSRFRREAELAARLDHSGIATVYGAGVEADRPWIAMRLVEGETLARAITRARGADDECVRLGANSGRGRDSVLAIAACLAKVARALQAAHDQGVVHRDIKPSNIIVAVDGSPVLIDFGLAITEESDGRSVTRTGETAGTPAYLAPEIVGGSLARPDAQCDVYALGVTLYECLALARPFEAPTPAALYHAIVSGSTADVRTSNRAVPRDLAVVVATAMERDRSRRYATAAALAADLEACVAGLPIAARPVPLLGRAWRWARRDPRLASALAAVFVVAIAGSAWVSIVQSNARDDMAAKNVDLESANAKLAGAKAAAESNEKLATRRAEDVLSLSAIQDLEELVQRADRLWPTVPANIAAYDEWLVDARTLLEGRPADPTHALKKKPGLAEHRQKLGELEKRAVDGPSRRESSNPSADGDREWNFADSDDRWWHQQLEKLVHELQAFSDPNTGLFSAGLSPEHGLGVTRRLEIARAIADRSLECVDAHARWTEAIASVDADARFTGLHLTPQMAMIPVGADPTTRLWEFAHLLTGAAPTRGPDGKLRLDEGSAMVFVLVPGGTYSMGSQAEDPSGPNYSEFVSDGESPVHTVALKPFFISKYEMTQSQWLRFTGHNPSQYQHDKALGERGCSLLCPVEQVSWFESRDVAARLGLTLPSEEQWEYAARAGTRTPWWTGATMQTLVGAVNLADKHYEADGGPASWHYEQWLDDGWSFHAPVDGRLPNPFGLHDVLGNVWEWASDRYAPYGAQVEPAPEQTVGDLTRTCRGGGFNCIGADARSAIRFHGSPEYRSYDIGLRPVRGIDAP